MLASRALAGNLALLVTEDPVEFSRELPFVEPRPKEATSFGVGTRIDGRAFRRSPPTNVIPASA